MQTEAGGIFRRNISECIQIMHIIEMGSWKDRELGKLLV